MREGLRGIILSRPFICAGISSFQQGGGCFYPAGPEKVVATLAPAPLERELMFGSFREKSSPGHGLELNFTIAQSESKANCLFSANMASRILPLKQDHLEGQLISLKTTLELRPGDSLLSCYVVRCPLKDANSILGYVKSPEQNKKLAHHLKSTTKELYANTTTVDLGHLRRFSKAQALPVHVMNAFGITPPKVEGEAPKKAGTALYLLVGPTKGLTPEALALHLEKVAPECGPGKGMISTQLMPLLAPTSSEQAQAWSKQYWPCIYKKSNPFGPHPSIVERAVLEIGGDVSALMAMASKVGNTAKAAKMGEPVGALIVDRSGGSAKIVALAADGRWNNHDRPHGEGPGNIMAHATLRAIGMVAQKMKAKGDKYALRRDPVRDPHERSIFGDTPLLPPERVVYEADNISADGYLCHGLEIYLTHEPCIMCSMAILHSRFAKVTFGQRMPRTGGMSSEGETNVEDGLGYGLFWRKELNWSLLAWEFKEEKVQKDSVLHELTHA